MMDVIITLFEALDLYSTTNGLGDHLKGLDVACENNTNQSIYSIVLICILVINSLIMLNYYYGYFNRPRFSKLLSWFYNMLFGAIIIFLIAFLYTNDDLNSGNYCQELIISTSDCIGFASVSAFYSIVWGALFSFGIKWKSSNNKKVPR